MISYYLILAFFSIGFGLPGVYVFCNIFSENHTSYTKHNKIHTNFGCVRFFSPAQNSAQSIFSSRFST